jgi:hypothetical protein
LYNLLRCRSIFLAIALLELFQEIATHFHYFSSDVVGLFLLLSNREESLFGRIINQFGEYLILVVVIQT